MRSSHVDFVLALRRSGLVCALAGVALLVSPCASADVPNSITFVNPAGFTVNRHYDVNSSGALINLWQLNHNRSQDWFWSSDVIRSASNNNYCLNIHNYALQNGAVINLWQCNGHASQQWVLVGNTIRPKGNTNFCLNLHNYDNSNGATINLWQCNGHASQDWSRIHH